MKRILSLIAGIALYASTVVAQGTLLQFNESTATDMFSNNETIMKLQSNEAMPFSLPYTAAKHVEFKYHGIYCVTDVMMAYDFVEKVSLKGMNISGGWQWRRQSGFGLGISYLSDAEGVFSQMPIYAELRSHYLRNQVTPYTSLIAGYTLPMGRRNGNKEMKREVISGGVMAGLSVGARYAFNRNVAINAFVGYQLQSLRVERLANSNLPNTDPNYHKDAESIIQNFIKFGFGINF